MKSRTLIRGEISHTFLPLKMALMWQQVWWKSGQRLEEVTVQRFKALLARSSVCQLCRFFAEADTDHTHFLSVAHWNPESLPRHGGGWQIWEEAAYPRRTNCEFRTASHLLVSRANPSAWDGACRQQLHLPPPSLHLSHPPVLLCHIDSALHVSHWGRTQS